MTHRKLLSVAVMLLALAACQSPTAKKASWRKSRLRTRA